MLLQRNPAARHGKATVVRAEMGPEVRVEREDLAAATRAVPGDRADTAEAVRVVPAEREDTAGDRPPLASQERKAAPVVRARRVLRLPRAEVGLIR